MRWAVALVALAACQAPAEHRRLTGTFTYGFEVNDFRELGKPDQYWCLSSAGTELLNLERPPRMRSLSVDLTVEAEIGPPGRYGHLGTCAREVRIIRVIERGLPYCPYSRGLCAEIEAVEAARD